MRIVADTNVLVSALLAPGGGPGALLAAVDTGEAVEVTPVSRDPDDDYLIALARATGVDVVVTGDEDLTSLELDDLEILTPRQVLDRLS